MAVDKFEHLGVSFAINTAAYFFFSRALHLEKEERWKALLMSALLTAGVCMGKEAIDAISTRSNHLDWGDLAAGGIGLGLSTAIIVPLDF